MTVLDSRTDRQPLPQPQQALRTPGTIVHKFGGSSLADASRIRHVAGILRARPDLVQVVVVSAMGGVTDALLDLAAAASRNDAEWRGGSASLRERHLDVARELNAGDHVAAWLRSEFEQLDELLHACSILRATPEQALSLIQGLGEVWSARLIAEHLSQSGDRAAMLDARDLLVVKHTPLGVTVDWSSTTAAFEEWRREHQENHVVVTGFIARDAEGRPTTLGRNGSDYSGSIFAALFAAEELHIWTDVDGVMSADPRLVPEAVALKSLSYREACELAYFGAKVIHPQTMTPAMNRDVPIYIRNSFRPEHPGTKIAAAECQETPVKGLTLSSELAIVNVEGAGMIGVPGTAERVFAALHRAGVSVVMISQGSSEHSICCVVREREAATARRALEEAFALELANGQLQSVQVSSSISVLAAVGDGMAGTPGIAARLFGTLARAQVNVRAIAQGSSERNISVAISTADAERALRAAHAGFWLSPQTISLGIIGPGRVGAALLEQLQSAAPRLRRDAQLDLRIRAVTNSRSMWLSDDRAPAEWSNALTSGEVACELGAFARHLHQSHLPHTVIIDCSSSDEVADRYAEWLASGIHVITPNKRAGAGPLARYRAIQSAAADTGARFRYEATVGAGLPIIQTLRDLIDTGDELHSVDGILSGTLAWLFNHFDGSMKFSALVREAHRLGYTEPDPRDDLSGMDVARKLVILAREAGRELELDQIEVESLVPASLREASSEEFLDRLHEVDHAFADRHARATGGGRVLRHVARLDDQGATVSLRAFPMDHAFARLRLTDNIVQFGTRRYAENPLIVQGPGAGPDVTAAGIFADLLRVAASLGARV